jgi:hypothetical protein
MRTLICVAVSVLMLAAPAADAMAFGGGFGGGPGGPGGGPKGGSPSNMWGDLEFKPVVGQWSEYTMDAEGDKPMTMRIAIVGKEGEAYWYETAMTDPEGKGFISKMLVDGDPEDMGNVKRMIMKPGDEPAMEMPVQMMNVMEGMGEGMGEPEEETPEPTGEDLGVEKVTVPAGTFDAHHWRFTSGEDVFDAWVSEAVGPYGLVKSETNGVVMILTGHGDKAVTQITEEPRQIPPMGGGPMGGMGGK